MFQENINHCYLFDGVGCSMIYKDMVGEIENCRSVLPSHPHSSHILPEN